MASRSNPAGSKSNPRTVVLAVTVVAVCGCAGHSQRAHSTDDGASARVGSGGSGTDRVTDAGIQSESDASPERDSGSDATPRVSDDAGARPASMAHACKTGFMLDAATGQCTDIDECATDNGGCDSNAKCTGSKTPAKPPTCSCNHGFEGDGKHCELRFRSVVTDGQHACGLGGDGSLYCWGDNTYGQIGTDEGRIGSAPIAPTRVAPYADWDELAVGITSTCAIRSGILYCWGDNRSGQLGLGTDKSRGALASVAGVDWFGLSVGGTSVCGLRGRNGTGFLYCFGHLVGSDQNQPTPMSVDDLRVQWKTVSTNGDHTCAIRYDGALFCWGDSNSNGELGLGDTAVGSTPVGSPTRVGDASDWTSVKVGPGTSCGLRRTGELWCWGTSYYGPSAGTDRPPSPVQQGVWDDWTDLTLGMLFGCGIRAGGELWCWGWNKSAEQAADPKTSTLPSAMHRIGSDAGWSQVSAGTGTACGVRDGRMHCWGSNQSGKLGTLGELRYTIPSPERVGKANDWVDVNAGWQASCGVRGDKMYCWGIRNDVDALAAAPEQVGTADGWTRVAVGYAGAALGVRGGQLYRWSGFERTPEPALDDAAGGWSSIVTAQDQPWSWSETKRCGLRSGSLYCWGPNDNGELGLGDTNSRDAATLVSGTWKTVSMGYEHTCAISGADDVYCWGASGEIGTNATANAVSPVKVGGDSGWTMVAAGGTDTCAIRNGALYCWQAAPPAQVGAEADWKTVSVSGSARCGIRGTALYCWGASSPRLGLPDIDGVVTDPTLVDDGSTSSWQQVSIGALHTCGIRGDGSLWCWGQNDSGQTGIEPSWSIVPREVIVQ